MVQALSIRTKLIMAMLALVASVALMGMTADDANAAGVTEIRWVENHTPHPVYVWNHESGAYKVISPNSAASYNQWVPWAFGREFFYRSHIELGYLWPNTSKVVPRIAIWQENRNTDPYPGDKVRYTNAQGTINSWHLNYNSQALPISGNSSTGGRRNLIITYTGWQVTPFGQVPAMHARLCQPC
jgi:hypothetical protein